MIIETDAASRLRMESLIIQESRFRRPDGDVSGLRLRLSVNRDVQPLGENRFSVVLETGLTDPEETFEVYVRAKGEFLAENVPDHVIEKNTVAIMFPYVRSMISALTAQPGLTPVVLPPMNIAAMLEAKSD